MIEEKVFSLAESDKNVLTSAAYVTKKLAGLWEKIDAKKLIGLARALHALERMPLAIREINIEYGISLSDGREVSSNTRYWDILISDDVFEVRSLGAIYNAKKDELMSQRFHFRAETNGYRACHGSINDWVEEIEEALCTSNLTLHVNDRSRLVTAEIVK